MPSTSSDESEHEYVLRMPCRPHRQVSFPELHTLFAFYDQTFFEGKLSNVNISWSKRMTRCAGTCDYDWADGSCDVKLSEPLLIFQPIASMLNTLLHEMIHAYLFIHEAHDWYDSHAGLFETFMNKINRSNLKHDPYRPEEGYNVTTTHDYYGEVDFYLRHIWVCNRCGEEVKRPNNRPPSFKECGGYCKGMEEHEVVCCDRGACLHHSHEDRCGGRFVKMKVRIEGPEGEEEKKEAKRSKTKAKTSKGKKKSTTKKTKRRQREDIEEQEQKQEQGHDDEIMMSPAQRRRRRLIED